MPRRTRKLSESNVYHVMIRGNERKSLFLDDEDRLKFIDIMKQLIERANKNINEKKFSVYAYCLMENHVHILIHQGEDTISRIMKRIGTSYAYYFNKKYSRIGHLFQDRFKSEAVENEGYLLAVVRYIHNNPVKAGIVSQAFQYQWSSCLDYADEAQTGSFVDSDTVLLIFSEDREKATELFRKYIQQENYDNFVEYDESFEEKVLKNKNDIDNFIANFLFDKGIPLEQLMIKKAHRLERT